MEIQENSEQNLPIDHIILSGAVITKDNVLNIVDVSKDFAVSKGMCMRKKNLNYDERVIVPFCLFPSPFPKKWFDHVKSIQRDMNYVLHKISYSPDFLRSCFEGILQTDKFIFNIFQIYEKVLKEEQSQLSLGLLRIDYMLATDSTGVVTGIKQIESNAIASSFGGLSKSVFQLHKFVLEKLGLTNLCKKLPENNTNVSLAKGLIQAWEFYGSKKAAILFVVEKETTNICDQRSLEFSMYEIESQIPVIRYSFSVLHEKVSLKDGKLYVDKVEVAVVYYRTGYVPDQYEPADWDLRLLMERSKAFKCPSVGYHLAGSKIVQLNLLLPGVLERFLPENSDPKQIRSVFAKQFSLKKGPEGDKAIQLALSNPHQFVLKPDRDGGGNNIYGDDIIKKLKTIQSSDERQAYILMDKINAPKVQNCIIRPFNQPADDDVLCELGIYGVIMGSKDIIFSNYEAGHLIRSKEFHSDEGGIVAGFGALDSPLLF